MQVIIHHGAGAYSEYPRSLSSGAGVVGKPIIIPVVYSGSSTAALTIGLSNSPSSHSTVLGSSPFVNTSLILGPKLVSGVVSGNSMKLFAFYEPQEVRELCNVLLPEVITLAQNFPNPFNPTTEIKFAIPQPMRIRIHIFNTMGQKVNTLIDDDLLAGVYSIKWNGTDASGHKVSSGIYFYQLDAGEFIETKKMLFVK